ncbi:MAG: response regulator [Chloroflexota bacterium]
MPDQLPGSGHPAPSVLIADDSEVTLDQVSDFLGRLGLKAYSARNGLELLELASVLKPDIIMIDIQMPGMDAFETVKRLRASYQPDVASIPVIAITALAIPGDQERCLEAGVNEYLCKPITIKQLSQKIKQLYLGEK